MVAIQLHILSLLQFMLNSCLVPMLNLNDLKSGLNRHSNPTQQWISRWF